MKKYENVPKQYLIPRIPVIIRIDGRAFHTLTRKKYGKNWSSKFVTAMMDAAYLALKEMQGCKFCYSQSDEVSFLLTDYRTINTKGWFDYNLQKIVSVSASIASAVFSFEVERIACFDSRTFNIPHDEVCNYFIWRQIDATRNAIQMLGQEHFSHKQLYHKSCSEIQEMLFVEKGINFNDLSTIRKRGFCYIDGKLNEEIPIFSKDRKYVEKHVYIRED